MLPKYGGSAWRVALLPVNEQDVIVASIVTVPLLKAIAPPSPCCVIANPYF